MRLGRAGVIHAVRQARQSMTKEERERVEFRKYGLE
jgi:hypothetical protein